MKGSPMGGGGLNVNIRGGQPVIHQTQQQREDAAKLKHEAAMQKASLLVRELTSTPALKVVSDLLTGRLIQFMQEDQQCQGYINIIMAMRHDIEVAPVAAEREVNRIMGPKLMSMKKEAEAAP